MAIYPTKTKKLNNKNKRIWNGVSLISIFSVMLILLCFNFIEIFTIAILGSFGLCVYPLCLFFITLGILKLCNVKVKTSKSIIILSCFWLFVFILILQLATSSNIDSSYAIYISSTFKSCSTAGGVVFGTILYPIYYLTYDIASYIIFSIIIVVLTALIIDKVYVEIKNKKILRSSNSSEDDASDNFIEEELEENYIESSNYKETNDIENDDIFISDDDEIESRNDAKNILGLTSNTIETTSVSKDIDYIEKIESAVNNSQSDYASKVNEFENKPNIYVHDEDDFNFNSINNTSKEHIKNDEPKIDKEEEKRKAALAYLNISKGKFETKNKEKGFDNLSGVNNSSEEKTKIELQKQTNDNAQRLNSLADRFNSIQNNRSDNAQNSYNPFKEREQQSDIFDNNFTKKEFMQNQESYAKSNDNFNHAVNSMTEMASKVYSGEVKDNIVEEKSFRPVQISMEEPQTKPKPNHKIYKKPPTYVKPSTDLLIKYSQNIEDDSEYIREKGELIVNTLKTFKIETKIINAVKGPTFTRYELQMAPGISVNSINSKVNDLSMALESACRVQVPIPGKNAFGIEVPNKKRIIVGIRDIIESTNFQTSKSPLTFALGKDISGDCKVAAIDKLNHTLVAGSTGSGKSVCLNTMLVSLLYKASPEDLRLILIDPKTVEFSLFNNLPHMLIPNTITECDKAIQALAWLVEEMDRRYKQLNALGVKKITEYNETPEVLSGAVEKMYYIVTIFDEVGDFMSRTKKDEIEGKIILLAAKARACGIHLILATQRPTVDVITGTIKANLPSRIAFAVNSYQDSKTILESAGAEALLGMGDMLFQPQGSNELSRIQGCLIETKELKAVINFIKENNEAVFDDEIQDQMFNKKEGFDPTSASEESFDPMLKDCLKYFIKAKRASASSIQSYFGMGYPRATKIVMQMEKAGFVSAGDSNGRRTLFITQQEYEERFGEDLDE